MRTRIIVICTKDYKHFEERFQFKAGTLYEGTCSPDRMGITARIGVDNGNDTLLYLPNESFTAVINPTPEIEAMLELAYPLYIGVEISVSTIAHL